MATTSPYFYDPNNPLNKKPINGLVQSMTGTPAFNPSQGVTASSTPAFTPTDPSQGSLPSFNAANFDPSMGVTASGGTSAPASGSTSTTLPTLPANYNFNDLADYVTKLNNQFGDTASQEIMNTRDQVAKSLNDYGQQFFAQQNPALLEDLNSRGLLTSQSEVANKEAQALKEIATGNEQALTQYDQAALSAKLQAQQDAIDAASNLRSTGLEANLQNSQTQAELAQAASLAKQQGRNNLNNSLIGAGGSLLGGSLPYVLPHLFGSTAAGAGAAGAGAAAAGTAGASGVAGAGGTAEATGIGLGGALGATAGIGAGLASYELTRKALAKNGIDGTTGKVLSAVPGVGLSVLGGQKVVNALGGGAGHTENGNAIAATASSLQQQRGDLTSLKQAHDSGQIDDATYNAQLLPALKQYNQMVNSALSQGSVWASSITPEWNALLQTGMVKAVNGQWVTDTGQVLWNPQKGYTV